MVISAAAAMRCNTWEPVQYHCVILCKLSDTSFRNYSVSAESVPESQGRVWSAANLNFEIS